VPANQRRTEYFRAAFFISEEQAIGSRSEQTWLDPRTGLLSRVASFCLFPTLGFFALFASTPLSPALASNLFNAS
jgi:hypothetical protein